MQKALFALFGDGPALQYHLKRVINCQDLLTDCEFLIRAKTVMFVKKLSHKKKGPKGH